VGVSADITGGRRKMHNPAIIVPYVILMIAVIVVVDILIFRDRTWSWERLAYNAGVVLVFGAFYFRFLAK
jgi:hypothetical protein